MLSNTLQITIFSFRKTAHKCIVCVTQSSSVKNVFFCDSLFWQLMQKHKLNIWGGIVKHLLIAYFIGNISAKKYENPFMCVKSYSKPKVGCFLRHGVVNIYFVGHFCVQDYTLFQKMVPERRQNDLFGGHFVMQIRWSKTQNFVWEPGSLDSSHLNYGKNCGSQLLLQDASNMHISQKSL